MTVALVEKYEGLWEDAKAAEGCRRCLIGQLLQERLGRPFIVENRPGADSNTATEAVINAPP